MIVAFTGHREFNPKEITAPLYEQLRELASRGDVIFLSGMAVGFDMAAAEAVIKLREEYGDVRLECVVPFEAQPKYFSNEDQIRYNKILECADDSIILEPSYSEFVYLRRNDYLVKSADMIIAYYDGGGKGGTAYTYRKAKNLRLPIINLYPQQQLSLF